MGERVQDRATAAPGRAAMMADRLIPALFDDPAHPLAASLAGWIAASPRFAAFVAAHGAKIRKKVRGARDPEACEDLRFELAIAEALHRERHCAVAYEPRVLGQGRTPDFTLTYRESTILNLEVTRMLPARPAADEDRPERAAGDAAPPHPGDGRLVALVCGKLGQLVPNMTNVLVAGVAGDVLRELELPAAMRRLQQRAERGEPALFARHGFRDPADFFKQYRRLSGLVLRPWPPPEPAQSPALWANGQATHPIPTRVRALLERSM